MPIGTMIADVPGVSLRLPKWEGEPFVDDFGKKGAAMIELDGEHVLPEIAVLRLLERDGWSGRWVVTQGGKGEIWKYVTEWRDVPREEQRNRPIEESEPRQMLQRIASMNRPARYKGCWDVFAWRGEEEVAFFQCKRSTGKGPEEVKLPQVNWLRSALYLGDRRLKLGSFCFVQWDYA